MKEKILSIAEINKQNECSGTWYEGFEIKTDKQSILILIESGRNCCEDYGYIVSEDDLKYFIGAEVMTISVTDTTHNTKMVKKFEEMAYSIYGYKDGEKSMDLECGGIEFVNVGTNKGELQFAVYNCHNGYYGHNIMIRFNDTEIADIL